MLADAEENWDRGHCLQTCLTNHLFGNPHHYSSAEFSPDEFAKRLIASFEAMGFESLSDGYHWNDQEGRTREEVVERIREAL
jgi:hypothetical protein